MSSGDTTLTRPGPAEQAFALLVPEMQALPTGDLLRVNVDVARVTGILLGAAPGMLALRERLLEVFRNFDVQRFERLESYALCLQHTHAVYLAARSCCSAEQIQRGLSLRTRLTNEARALARSGVVDETPLRQLSRAQGYLNLSTDLGILVRVLGACPAAGGEGSGVLAGVVAEAAQLVPVFLQASDRHETSPQAIASAKEWRRRAYTNLYYFYKWVRLAVLYTRLDERDGEKLAPSLFSFRGPRGGADELSER